MKRWLYCYESVRGTPERLEQVLRHRVRELLAEAVDGQGAELTPEGDLLVRLPAQVLGRDMHKSVRLHTGVAEQHGGRMCIPLRWHAEPARVVFPSFDGTIELEQQSSVTANVTIVGAATLPLGALGGAVDATVLGSVADRTIRHLASGLADALERAASRPDPREPAPPSEGMRVRDAMTPSPLVLHEEMPLKTAALLLFHYDVAGAPVRSDSGGLVGVLSEADLIDVAAPLRHGLGRDADASRRRRAARTVGQACSRPVREVAVTAPVRRAAELMRDHDVARLVVVDGSDVVGVVSRHDVLKALLRSDAEIREVLDRLLADRDEGGVTASVEWGVVQLAGEVSTRSGVDDLVSRVEALDGVLAVDAELNWRIDDVLPPAMPLA